MAGFELPKNMDSKELGSFLDKVEEIESIVKGLNSRDDTEVQTAVERADKKLAELKVKVKNVESEETKGFNRTVINTCGSTPDPYIQPGMPKDAFIAAMEQDARERSERRKVQEREANVIKEEGNKEFKDGNYEKAVELYSKALKKVPDSHVLYTNRAQALIRLEKYQEALSDCDWALRAFPNCTKAFVHQGKAYLALGQFQQARESYENGLKTDPKKKKLFQSYMDEVNRCENAKVDEEKVKELFEAGTTEVTSLVELLSKVKKRDQLPIYYAGGFRIIADQLTGVTAKTLFRTHGGLQISVGNSLVSRCLSTSPNRLTREELDMLCSAVDLLCKACSENETNQAEVLETANLSTPLLDLLTAKVKSPGSKLQESIIAFIHCLSLTSVGRSKVVQKLDMSWLTCWVFSLVQSNTTLAGSAVGMLNNLALDKQFRQRMRDITGEEIMALFDDSEKTGGKSEAVLASCIHMTVNLTGDPVIRKRLMKTDALWKSCLSNLKRLEARKIEAVVQEILVATMSLLINLSTETNPCLVEHSHDCCVICLKVAEGGTTPQVLEKCLSLVSLTLPHAKQTVDWLCDYSYLPVVMKAVKSETARIMKPALKILTVCTQSSQAARQFTVGDKGILCLVELLKYEDESVVGNSALCLSHCVQQQGVCASLADTAIVRDLLVLARDGRKPALQQNCGILLAKLAQGDSRHLESLRELHGIEILHQACGKHLR